MGEYRKAKKEFLRTVIVGDFFVFKLYKVTDAAKQVYYIGSRTNRGGTVIGDTEQDVIRQLEAQVPLIKQFLEKTK
jgi:hypothetical protein